MLGAFAISVPMTADASVKRIHDPKVETKSEVRRDSGRTIQTLREAVSETMNRYEVTEEKIFDEAQNFFVPTTTSSDDTSIIGTPMATQQQCVNYLLRNNPHPNLNVSPEQIVAYYYEEGRREGIRPDVAFAQALKETGFFRYGGDVIPEQNNYCGLGTTGGGVKGEFFATPQLGVRAHIQHLLAYSSTRRPTTPVVDPRYTIVRQAYGSRTLGTWQDLNGRWAVPGRYYGQEILSMFRAILVQ
ncbi:MAG: glucosaminidase domain-containing protein [Selenomonadaceae bacterium]|nr:glucosaminidase domain-containing protein [Selenomonadaceae bacterium]